MGEAKLRVHIGIRGKGYGLGLRSNYTLNIQHDIIYNPETNDCYTSLRGLMMEKVKYIKDTKKFWETRHKARKSLDHKRAAASYSEKTVIAHRLHEDMTLMKKGRVVHSKEGSR